MTQSGSQSASVRPRRRLALALLVLAGCGHAPPVPETRYHQFESPQPAGPAAAPLLTQPLWVDRLVGDDLRRDRAWVYSPAPPHLSLQESHLHYWVDAPGQLLQAYLRDFLVAQGVVAPDMLMDEVATGYWVKGEIRRLEREFEPDGEFVHVELELRLGRSGVDQPLVYGRYAERRAVAAGSGAEIQATVAAYSAALAQICGQFVQAIRAKAATEGFH